MLVYKLLILTTEKKCTTVRKMNSQNDSNSYNLNPL